LECEEKVVSDEKFFAELCDPDGYRDFAPFALNNIWQMENSEC